jgi:glyoxylase-like metal-dependent hydrolase (beta-lactamase superfamily II)
VFAEAFARIGVDPAEISWLLLTHGHPDHMGGHPTLRPHAPFSVAAPLEDVIWVESVERQWHDF